MRESADIAYGYLVGHAAQFGADPQFFKEAFIHLHVPAGATPKDGPSAGVTMASALLSLARDEPVRDVAMTGEITLTGQVFPVGGIREKVIAAKRAGIKVLILPEENRGDFDEIPDYIRKGMKAHFASRYEEVVPLLFKRGRSKR
jgi:ATP-dependent Lon protease